MGGVLPVNVIAKDCSVANWGYRPVLALERATSRLSHYTMRPLNLDVIHLVLDTIYWENDGSVDHVGLAAASRIASIWRIPAQARLFHKVAIYNRKTLVAFGRSAPTASKRGRQLRSTVRQLEIVISGHSTVLGIPPPLSLLERDMLSLLPSLPNLYQLFVHSIAPSLSRGGHKRLSSMKVPSIRSLIVHYASEVPERTHRIFIDTLSAIPSVERVLLIGKGTYAWPSFHPELEMIAPNVQLKELRIDLRHSQPSLTGKDVQWLISQSPSSLEILHLYDLVLDETMPLFITNIAAQLRSFHVSSSRQSDLASLPLWVKNMERLEDLVIRNDMASAECFKVITDLPPLIAALPFTVRHLGFAADSRHSYKTIHSHLLDWARRRGSNLAVLTLVLTFNDAKEKWLDLPIRQLRLYRYDDEDTAFCFASRHCYSEVRELTKL